MTKQIFAGFLLSLGSGLVSIGGVALTAPLFARTVGPVRNTFIVAMIGTMMLLIGWRLLLPPKPRRAFAIHLIVTWWGGGLVLGMMNGSSLTQLSAREWTGVLVGAVAVAYGVFALRTRQRQRHDG